MEPTPSYDTSSLEEHIEILADILNRYALTRVDVTSGDTHVVLEKTLAAEAVTPVKPPLLHENSSIAPDKATLDRSSDNLSADVLASDRPSKHTVKAPLVGIAYRSKDPGTPPFVEVGDVIDENTVLCLIEAMKMFNEVKASVSGVITAIHFEEGQLVEHGAPLFTID